MQRKNYIVYLDNGAATRLDERVLEEMKPYFFDVYAVASSEFGYSLGIEAKEGLEGARKNLAGIINASPDEFVFTSGSTESSNLAIKGVAQALNEKEGKHIITSKIEDFPVLNSVKALQKKGFEATYLNVDSDGLIDLDQLKDSIGKNTILVSIQHGNQGR